MREYKIVEIGKKPESTVESLNELARVGWIIVCSYGKYGQFLILKRKMKIQE